jgi:hypothetical protein
MAIRWSNLIDFGCLEAFHLYEKNVTDFKLQITLPNVCMPKRNNDINHDDKFSPKFFIMKKYKEDYRITLLPDCLSVHLYPSVCVSPFNFVRSVIWSPCSLYVCPSNSLFPMRPVLCTRKQAINSSQNFLLEIRSCSISYFYPFNRHIYKNFLLLLPENPLFICTRTNGIHYIILGRKSQENLMIIYFHPLICLRVMFLLKLQDIATFIFKFTFQY